MRKGLTQTLWTVAVVLMAAVQAYAAAPVILNIPSPVVGDAENATPTNYFVYPDAITLSDWVTDDSSNPTEIMWSYDIAGPPKYMINGVGPLGSGDPLNPGANQINSQVLGGEEDHDTTAATITVRNINLTPLGGTPPFSPPGADDDEQLVTLYASDGTDFDTKTISFYTQHGADHLTGGFKEHIWGGPGEGDFEGNTNGFTFSGSAPATSSLEGGHAICVVIPDNQVTNVGVWTGTMGMLELIQNQVYRVRARVNGSQAAGGTASNVPFWDLIINNFQVDQTTTPWHGMNLYGANYFFLDNTGRANAAVNMGSGLTDGKNFDLWWCPTPISTDQWNVTTTGPTSGPYNPGNATDDGLGHGKDAFIEFRVLDTPDNPGTTANSDFGTLCLRELTIDRWDLKYMTVESSPALYHPTLSSTSHRREGGDFSMTPSGGGFDVMPTLAGQTAGITGVVPGDGVLDMTLVDGASWTDDYPVPMDPQTLYMVTMSLSSAGDVTKPPEIFWLGADTPTNELICMTYVTYNCNKSAMPKTTPQDYKCLFFSNGGTVSTNPTFLSQFRPRFMVGNVGLNPDAETGGIRINSMQVDKVSFGNME